MEIRNALISDKERISEISSISGYVDYITPNLDRMISNGGMFVFEEEKMIKALFQVGFSNRTWISALRVDPQFRNLGIASKMLKWAENESSSRGFHSMGCLIEKNNSKSISLFQANGFKEVSRYFTSNCSPEDSEIREIKGKQVNEKCIMIDWEVICPPEGGDKYKDAKLVEDSNRNLLIRYLNDYYVLETNGQMSKTGNRFTSWSELNDNKMRKYHSDCEIWEYIHFRKII